MSGPAAAVPVAVRYLLTCGGAGVRAPPPPLAPGPPSLHVDIRGRPWWAAAAYVYSGGRRRPRMYIVSIALDSLLLTTSSSEGT